MRLHINKICRIVNSFFSAGFISVLLWSIFACAQCLALDFDWFDTTQLAQQGEDVKRFEFSEVLGYCQFKDGSKFPVQMLFRPARVFGSRLAGEGWLISLVDAYAIYDNESLLRIMLPSGKLVFFSQRDDGQWIDIEMQWTVQLAKNLLTITSKSGWKLTYLNGMFSHAEKPDFASIIVDRSKPNAVSASLDGKDIFRLERSPDNQKLIGALSDKPFVIDEIDYPVLSDINGTVVFIRNSKSVGCVTVDGKHVRKFEYNQNSEQLRFITFIADTMPETSGSYDAITGKTKIDTSGGYNLDQGHSSLDNNPYTFVHFESGIVASRLRYRVLKDNPKDLVRFTYDADGRLLRAKGSAFSLSRCAGGFLATDFNLEHMYNFSNSVVQITEQSSHTNQQTH